jgi:hypothetical protein
VGRDNDVLGRYGVIRVAAFRKNQYIPFIEGVSLEETNVSMKFCVVATFLLLSSFVVCVTAAETHNNAASTNGSLHVFVNTPTGCVEGVISGESLHFMTAYGKIDIKPELMDSAKISADRKSDSLVLRSGDKFSGTMLSDSIVVITPSGKSTISMSNVVTIEPAEGAVMSPAILNSLVLYYSLDQSDDAKIKDQSGNGNDSENRGAKYVSNGKRGGGLEFDGVTNNTKNVNDIRPNLHSFWSLSFWVKYGLPQDGTNAIASFGENHDPSQGMVVTRGQTGTSIGLRANYQSDAVDTSCEHDFNADFGHVAVTYDAVLLRLYVNGRMINTEPSHIAPTSYYTGYRLRLGGKTRGGMRYPDYFRGVIDEVMIFNRVLSDREIRQVYGSQR